MKFLVGGEGGRGEEERRRVVSEFFDKKFKSKKNSVFWVSGGGVGG